MWKNDRSLPGTRFVPHSWRSTRLMKAPWFSKRYLPATRPQVASEKLLDNDVEGKYERTMLAKTWKDLTIRGSSHPILPRARSLNALAPATRSRIESVHCVSGH